MIFNLQDLYKMFCYFVIYFTCRTNIVKNLFSKIPVNSIFTCSLFYGLVMALLVEGRYIEHMKNKKKTNSF